MKIYTYRDDEFFDWICECAHEWADAECDKLMDEQIHGGMSEEECEEECQNIQKIELDDWRVVICEDGTGQMQHWADGWVDYGESEELNEEQKKVKE